VLLAAHTGAVWEAEAAVMRGCPSHGSLSTDAHNETGRDATGSR
jgi:hypothetical protein